MDIVVDFDGTCVTHAYPEIGQDIGAIPILKKLVAAGHNLILFTMRSERPMKSTRFPLTGLGQAVQWFKDNDIPLYGIQHNPSQDDWTDSPKAYGAIIIDDAALGCPLVFDAEISERGFVDWIKVNQILKEQKIL